MIPLANSPSFLIFDLYLQGHQLLVIGLSATVKIDRPPSAIALNFSYVLPKLILVWGVSFTIPYWFAKMFTAFVLPARQALSPGLCLVGFGGVRGSTGIHTERDSAGEHPVRAGV